MENILNIITGKHASINLNATLSCLYRINVYKVTHWIQVASCLYRINVYKVTHWIQVASCLYRINVYKVTHWIQVAIGMVVVETVVVVGSDGGRVGDDDGGGRGGGDGGSMESNEVEKSWKRQKVGLLKTQADFILSEVAMRSLSAHSDPCTVVVFPTEGLIYFHPAGSDSESETGEQSVNRSKSTTALILSLNN